MALTLADTAVATVTISNAKWNAHSNRLRVTGVADNTAPVTVTNDNDPEQLIGVDDSIRHGNWKVVATGPSPIPCSVRAEQDGMSVVREVDKAPADCDPLPPPDIGLDNPQTDFKILMNYELGMHCTGFEFAYCCVLPVYNSILAQVVKPESSSGTFPHLLEGDPNVGKDFVGRETVLRDKALDKNKNFKKYVAKYWHEAQPRNNGRGKVQTSTIISNVEGNSLLMWNTTFDAAATDDNNALITGDYNGVQGVVQGDGDFNDTEDSYANGWLNHLYIYEDLDGTNSTGTSLEQHKIRLGLRNLNAVPVNPATPTNLVLPENSGPAFHPVGPDSTSGLNNVLTFTGDSGTVVYTQAKVLENLPIMLTSPRIWEALGLPLTPFEDSIDFYTQPGLVDEDSIRPFVAMKSQLYHFDPTAPDGAGTAVLDSAGNPVIGFGTAPIDIPNCERCHAIPDFDEASQTPNVNSPNTAEFPGLYAKVQQEINFWNAFYGIDVAAGDSDWYSRLKGAAISMLSIHDEDNGTSFTANYPGVQCTGNPDPITDPSLGCGELTKPFDPNNLKTLPQNTRLGKESVICQKCHGDNVIAVVKSASFTNEEGEPEVIPPISQAIHWKHRNTDEMFEGEGGPIVFNDSLGRDGGCQGCHPAHRSNGDLAGYPITKRGNNEYADTDNRLASGGCFVGRDVHSNPGKDTDGAETPEHLTAVGSWLSENVFDNQAGLAGSNQDTRGIWCTNCHNQLNQDVWATEDCNDLINGDCLVNPRGAPTLAGVATAVGLTESQAIDFLDPKVDGFDRGADETHAIWNPDAEDAGVATIEVGPNGPAGTTDADGDFSVNILSFCTTDDCVARINANKGDQSQWRYPANPFIDTANSDGVAPFSAATDGREHWLAPGEPHCADCHSAPYTEQSGNINAFPPFNYPAKASLMRYSRGHRDITCQGCHESIHGLYPVTPDIDTTTYAQAAALNADGSHGPIKCAACHDVNDVGVPNIVCEPGEDEDQCQEDEAEGLNFAGTPIYNDFDAAVSWAHGFTAEADLLNGKGSSSPMCRNCHEDNSDEVAEDNDEWLEHAMKNRVTRDMMDTVEVAQIGHISGSAGRASLKTLCSTCHRNKHTKLAKVRCNGKKWKKHLIEGRVNEAVWEQVSLDKTGSTCGW